INGDTFETFEMSRHECTQFVIFMCGRVGVVDREGERSPGSPSPGDERESLSPGKLPDVSILPKRYRRVPRRKDMRIPPRIESPEKSGDTK
ncbi:MAG: hypothetical protein ACTMIH_06940, partial [Microbacterium gubbeenense]